jgi:hypothetical protein
MSIGVALRGFLGFEDLHCWFVVQGRITAGNNNGERLKVGLLGKLPPSQPTSRLGLLRQWSLSTFAIL